MENLDRLIDEREHARRAKGYKSQEYLYLKRKIVYLRNKTGKKIDKSSDETKFMRRLNPLVAMLIKKERDKMLKDEKKELTRALRPYAVEAVINDEHQIDFGALRKITQEKINADRK